MKALVRIQGGLGNQLYQVAMARRLEEAGYQVRLLHLQNPKDIVRELQEGVQTGWQILKCPRILRWPAIRALSVARRLKKFRYTIHQADLSKIVERKQRFVIADGYFQSKDNAFSYIASQRSAWLRSRIEPKAPPTSLAVHIRLGDYRNNPKVTATLGVLDSSYYLLALNEVRTLREVERIVLFSDEPKLASEMLAASGIDIDVREPSESPLDDLLLMAAHSMLIISNSTYSAWAAYLAEHTHDQITIVAPSKWIAVQPEAIQMVKTESWKLVG